MIYFFLDCQINEFVFQIPEHRSFYFLFIIFLFLSYIFFFLFWFIFYLFILVFLFFISLFSFSYFQLPLLLRCLDWNTREDYKRPTHLTLMPTGIKYTHLYRLELVRHLYLWYISYKVYTCVSWLVKCKPELYLSYWFMIFLKHLVDTLSFHQHYWSIL